MLSRDLNKRNIRLESYNTKPIASLLSNGILGECKLALCECTQNTGFITFLGTGSKPYIVHDEPPVHDGTDNVSLRGKMHIAFNKDNLFGAIWFRCGNLWKFVNTFRPVFQNPLNATCNVRWCVPGNATGYCITENAVRSFPDNPGAIVDTTNNNNLNSGTKQRGVAFGNASFYGTGLAMGTQVADIGVIDWPIVIPSGGDFPGANLQNANFIEGNPYVSRMTQIKVHLPSDITADLDTISFLWLQPKMLPFIKAGQFGTIGRNYYNTPSAPATVSTNLAEPPITNGAPVFVNQSATRASRGTPSHIAMQLSTSNKLVNWYHGYSTPDNGNWWADIKRVNYVAADYENNNNKPLGNVTTSYNAPGFKNNDVIVQKWIVVRNNTVLPDPLDGLPPAFGPCNRTGVAGLTIASLSRFRPSGSKWEYLGGAYKIFDNNPASLSVIQAEKNWSSWDEAGLDNDISVVDADPQGKDRRLFAINNFGVSYVNKQNNNLIGNGENGLFVESLCSSSSNHVPVNTIKWFMSNVVVPQMITEIPSLFNVPVAWNGKTVGVNIVDELNDISNFN